MGIYSLFIGIGLLLLLILVLRLNAFIALIITALFTGLLNGMAVPQVLKSVQTGIGGTLGPLVTVLGFGVMLGKMLTESGAAQRLTRTMLRAFGPQRAAVALALTGFTVGLAMFYNAGFVVLLPLVFAMAAETGLPIIYLALTMAASLSVTHGFLPPHPGPTAIAALLKANVGLTLMYGIVVSIPAIVLAGLVFPRLFKGWPSNAAPGLFTAEPKPDEALPPFGISLFCAIAPVLLIAPATAAELTLPDTSDLRHALAFIGDPGVAMLIALLLAMYLLGKQQGQSMTVVGKYLEQSVGAVAMILLIIAGGGAFKQVLTDSGIGDQIAAVFRGSSLSPLFLGWMVAALVRVSLGSATVAGLMAGGIMAPVLAQSGGTSPELMALAIGAGSLMFSHVNDTGFWMFKEYFGLTIRQTILSWSLMETVVSMTGLAGVLVLDVFV
jgi:Gnt-I system high-affinity gluconate transporter